MINPMLTIDQLDQSVNVIPTITWLPAPQLPLLKENEVHVWRANLNMPAARIESLRWLLSSDEQSKAERFHFQKDRNQYIVARGLLRTILARYLDLDPAEIRFSYGSYGKPAMTNALGQDILNFNMSHSHGMALYAFTRGRKIGVDLEYIQTDFACEEIAARIFAPSENAILTSLPVDLKHEAFFNCWTRKEAFIKAKGLGLAYPLNQFEVSLRPGEPAKLLRVEDNGYEVSRWSLQELELGSRYAAALAVEGNGWQLNGWQWSEL